MSEGSGTSTYVDPPDGGYGWIVLLSCSLAYALTFGFLKSFGIYFVELQTFFSAEVNSVSWITSITSMMLYAATPLSNALCVKLGHRAVGIIGGILTALGFILAAFANSLQQLYITAGFITGLGYSISLTAEVIMLGRYFNKRRPLANALASIIDCMLTFAITPLCQLLVNSFAWRGAMLITGALQLHLCISGALLKPIMLNQERCFTEKASLKKEANKINEQASCTNPCVQKIAKYIDCTLIRHEQFMLYTVFGIFAAFGFFGTPLFLVPYARSLEIPDYEAAFLLSIQTITDLIGRVICSWIVGLNLLKNIIILTIAVMFLGISVFLISMAKTYVSLSIFSASYGMAFGCSVSMLITVLIDIVGISRFGNALGLWMLFRCFGALLGPSVSGIVVDKMGNYGVGFQLLAGAIIASALLLILLQVLNRRREQKQIDSSPCAFCIQTQHSRESSLIQ